MQFNAVIPELFVRNMKASLRFYVELLGFHVEYSREEGRFQFLLYERAQLMLFEEEDTVAEVRRDWITGALQYPRGRGLNLQIEVSSLGSMLASLERDQYPLYAPPMERERLVKGGTIRETEFLVQDPDGYLLRFSSAR
jgi:catechol 2,3-dioxygenase-like lactoylglutathione lyase family enzyme